MLDKCIKCCQRITIPDLVMNLRIPDEMMIVIQALPYLFCNMILGCPCIFTRAVNVIADRRSVVEVEYKVVQYFGRMVFWFVLFVMPADRYTALIPRASWSRQLHFAKRYSLFVTNGAFRLYVPCIVLSSILNLRLGSTYLFNCFLHWPSLKCIYLTQYPCILTATALRRIHNQRAFS